MNILVIGAGAIGSLFGALLSKKNKVILVGRTPRINVIQQQGLKITGKNHLSVKITAVDSIKEVTTTPDLILLTVKSYDTETAIKHTAQLLGKETAVLSLQNGLDNIEKIQRVINKNQILAGVTTHGAILSRPGVIRHTGRGATILGELTGRRSPRLDRIVAAFNEAGIETSSSTDINKEIWAKAIINSSINPLTTIFQCQNGYLLDNPVLEHVVESICTESVTVARAEGIDLLPTEMITRTKEVITETAQNYSSMLQSSQLGKQTEIDSINGALVKRGNAQGIPTPLNTILVTLVTSLSKA
jgi:2-dehydropantoate 2-reductase